MTVDAPLADVAGELETRFPGAVLEQASSWLVIKPESLADVCRYLRDTSTYAFDYLASLTAVDYKTYFELVYHLVSIGLNKCLVLKTRLSDRERPVLPSVTGVWKSAGFQEREAYDLFGISFEGHPDLRRIFMWDGFPGHPLRKDFSL